MMGLLDDLLLDIPDGKVIDIRVGLHWTAVVVKTAGHLRCGLASAIANPHEHGSGAQVQKAGALTELSGSELAELSRDKDHPALSSIGVAAINALLVPPSPERCIEGNAGHIIAKYGAGRRVAIVGHFPFIPDLRTQVGELYILSLNPGEGDLPADTAPQVLPQMERFYIQKMTVRIVIKEHFRKVKTIYMLEKEGKK